MELSRKSRIEDQAKGQWSEPSIRHSQLCDMGENMPVGREVGKGSVFEL